MVARDLAQLPAFFDETGRNLVRLLPVVVAGTARYETRVERGSDDEGHVLCASGGEYLIERILVFNQRILGGE
jgi:hypothetical protein